MTQPTTQRLSAGDHAYASLVTIAGGFQAGLLPAPTSVDIWVHHLPATSLLKYADEFAGKINLFDNHASVTVQPLTDPTSLPIKVHFMCNDLSKHAVAMYRAHNQICMTLLKNPAVEQ